MDGRTVAEVMPMATALVFPPRRINRPLWIADNSYCCSLGASVMGATKYSDFLRSRSESVPQQRLQREGP